MSAQRDLRFFNTTGPCNPDRHYMLLPKARLVGAQTPAYLIIFDRRPESKSKTWDERISWERDGDVTVLGC